MAGSAGAPKPGGGKDQAPPVKKRNDRATRLEKIYRIRTLRGLSKNGYSPIELLEYCMDEWGVKNRQATNYVNEMFESVQEALSDTDKRRIALTNFIRLDNAFKIARANKNPSAMVQACLAQMQHFMEMAPDANIVANLQARSAVADDPAEHF